MQPTERALAAQIQSKPPEHRAHVRVRMRLELKLRATDASGRKFEEMTTTENVSAGCFLCDRMSALVKGARKAPDIPVDGPGEYVSLCGPSLQTKAKDFQFGHEHFHFLESDIALLHFGSIDLWQIVWVKGFIHTP